MTRWLVGGIALAALVTAGALAGLVLASDNVATWTEVVITAERQKSGDVHLGLSSADGRVLSPGQDNIFRADSTSATSRPIAIEVVRPLEMDSERVVSGVGEQVGAITLSPGLWLCSTTFNTAKASRFSDARFNLIVGDEEYSDPTVGDSLYGSGAVFLVVAGLSTGTWTNSVPANVELPVTPVQARADHRWSLYCNRVSHKQ